MTELKNGQIYKAETLFAYRAILQWIEGDRWMLLSEPEKGTNGHSVMCPLVDPRTGTAIQSGNEMRARLDAHKWRLVSDVQVEFAEVYGREDMSEWQPIETAPADGSEVLLWDSNRCVVAHWDECEIWIPGYGAERRPNPSHWMPLPPAPALAA